jgi:CIC family chloride channel protein
MLTGSFGAAKSSSSIILLLSVLIVFKLVGTCVTLSSGGSGGVIAPSIFLGAALGSLAGSSLHAGGIDVVPTRVLALVGMGGVLAACVHCPLASILILFELTQDPGVVVPAMLVTVTATGIARLIFPDSIYTMSLHLRGLRPGGSIDQVFLRRLTVEQISLDAIVRVKPDDTIEHLIEVAMQSKADNFLVVNEGGQMLGMIVGEDLKIAAISHEAGMLVTAADLMRQSVPTLTTIDDLATAMDLFAEADLESIPVRLASQRGAVIGFLSRDTLMRLYQRRILEAA